MKDPQNNNQNRVRASKLALSAVQSKEAEIHSVELMSMYAQSLVAIGSKIIHGLEGKKFKEQFLLAAIQDDEKLTPMQTTPH